MEFSSIQVRARRYIDGVVKEEQIAENSNGFHNVSITYAVTADGTGNYISASTIIYDDIIDFQIYTSSEVPDIPQYAGFSFAISSWNHVFISNVLVGQAAYDGDVSTDGLDDIPSDDGIPADTPIYRLPLGTPITNGFELNENGEYVAKTNGSTLLQTVNANDLITAHGNQPINHIVTYGNPGYRVGTAVSYATGISKSGNIITPHGSCELSFDKTAHIYKAWAIDNGSSFSSINGLQVGWQAGD